MAAPNQFLNKYNAIRNSLAAGERDPNQRQIALARFDSDPRAQRLRQLAGLAPVSTAQQGVQDAAKQSLNDRARDYVGGAAQGASAGIARNFGFGIPELAAAAAEKLLPSSITGNNTNASFSNILQMIRSNDDQRMAAHPVAATVGSLGGGVAGLGLASRAITNTAGKAAASSSPIVSKIGQLVENLGTLRKGQKLANIAKLATMGGAAGAAQSEGEGGNPLVGGAEGAVAGPVAAGTAKILGPAFMRLGQALSSPFTDFLKLPNAARVLGKITSATTDQMQAEVASIKAANPNANPTLFEVLPLADRNRIMGQVASKSDNVAEQAGNAIAARGKQLAPEMQAQVSQILQPNRQAIQDGLVGDLTTARGGTPAEGDADLSAKALNSTTDMQAFRKTEADAYMAPHNDKIVGSLNDLIPSVSASDGTRLEVDPEMSNAIRTVAGSARSVPDKPLSVNRIVDMIHALKKPSATLDQNVAADAEAHLQGLLHGVDPEVAQSAQQMNDAYAARSRMIEGMSAGQDTQLRDPIDTGTNAKNARRVTNAYDTPEGAAGRAIGQGNTLVSTLKGGPGPALRLTNDIAGTNNDISRELGQNLGPDAAPIISAAQTNAQSGQALGTALNQIKGGGDEPQTPLQALTQVAAAFHPSSFAATKAKGVLALTKMAGIPEGRARTIVDMVFSQDPGLQAKAVNALGNEATGNFTKYLAGATGQVVSSADPANRAEPTVAAPASAAEVPADTATPDYSKMSDADLMKEVAQPSASAAPSTPPDYSKMSDADLMKEVGTTAKGAAPASPYAGTLARIYTQENPDVVSLVQRVKQQESHGDQSAVSKKGAVGTMQVMPATAPEAAKLAGVPWDPKAYKSDGTYNEILGHAYLAEQLRKYGGNVGQALAAYNAGPGAVDAAVSSHGDNWLTAVPAETQDYVARVES